MHTISFQTFFVWPFQIVVDSWKFPILLLYILSDDWQLFMISSWNKQLQQQLEYIGIRDSRIAGSLWGMMWGVGGVRKSIHQSWLAKGLGLGLLRWGFKGVQEEMPREEVSTLQIGSVAFTPGQCTSPQLHPCHKLFDQDGHLDSFSPSL